MELTSLFAQWRASRSQRGAWPRAGNATRASTPCSPYLADAAGLVRQQEIYARIQSASSTRFWITTNGVALPFQSLRQVLTQSVTRWPQHKKRRPPRCFPQAASFSAWSLSLVRLSVLDSFIVQVVLGRTVIGTTNHRLHADILHLRDQT